ncbi:MAG: hypothetical protein JWQ98_247 [Chlorobi bacterium]|nr:hypothetical protein [Chlorobiota bacterium]
MKLLQPLYLLAFLFTIVFASALHAQPGVRVVNVVSGAPPLDAYIDSSAPPAITGVAYGYASGVAPVATGNHHITITTSGLPPGFGVVDTLLSLPEKRIYALFLVGSGGIDQIVTSYAPGPIDSGRARVRFVNGALGGGNIDIAALLGGGEQIAVNALPYRASTDFSTGPATDLTVKVSPAGQPAIYRAFGYLTSGHAYTIVISGSADSIVMHAFDESDTNAQTPMVQFTPLPLQAGAFRAVNVANGFGPLDLYLDDASAAPFGGLAENSAGPQTTSLTGAHAVHISRAGEGAGKAVLTANVTIAADTSTTLFITSNQGTDPLNSVSLYRGLAHRPALGDIMVRVLNASPDPGAVTPRIILADGSARTMETIGAREATSYMMGTAGTVTIELAKGSATDPFMVVSGVAGANRIATAVISVSASNGTLAVRLLFENDDVPQEPLQLMTPTASAGGGESPGASSISIAPNPASGDALLSCTVHGAGRVRVALVNLVGQQVAVLADGDFPSGRTTIRFSTAGFPAGYYSVIVTGGNGDVTANGRMMIVR